MEFNYHLIFDNIIELVNIISKFKFALIISTSNKYLSKCIYHYPSLYFDTYKSKYNINNFLHVKNLLFRDVGNHGIDYLSPSLIRLQNLTIQYNTWYNRIININNIKKLTCLTRLSLISPNMYCLDECDKHVYNKTEIQTSIYFFHDSIRELNIDFIHNRHNKLITINCFNVNKLNLRGEIGYRYESPPVTLLFEKNTHCKLYNLSIRSLQLDINHSFANLTRLKIMEIDHIKCLMHLTNLLSFSLYWYRMTDNISIDNLTITKLKLYYCDQITADKLYNLRYLKLHQPRNFNICNVDSLQTVILDSETNMHKIQLHQCFRSGKINYMKVGMFEYSSNLDERLYQMRCHRIAIEGECKLRKLIDIEFLTHLILINNKKIKNVGGIKNLRLLTIAYDTFLYDKRNVVISVMADKEYITVKEAKEKYSNDLMVL